MQINTTLSKYFGKSLDGTRILIWRDLTRSDLSVAESDGLIRVIENLFVRLRNKIQALQEAI